MENLLTPKEIARVLGVQVSTIYQWTHQEFIPHVKLGRLVRFREDAVNKWIEKRSENGKVRRRIDLRDMGV